MKRISSAQKYEKFLRAVPRLFKAIDKVPLFKLNPIIKNVISVLDGFRVWSETGSVVKGLAVGAVGFLAGTAAMALAASLAGVVVTGLALTGPLAVAVIFAIIMLASAIILEIQELIVHEIENAARGVFELKGSWYAGLGFGTMTQTFLGFPFIFGAKGTPGIRAGPTLSGVVS